MNHRDDPDGATPLTPDERDGLKHKHVTTRGELDHLEQANVANGMRWMRRSRKKDLLTESYVRELHRQLFGEVWKWAGNFRNTEKNIGVDPREIGVELRLLLDDARYWIEHNTYSPKEIAIRFHHRLVFIHPFPNGNGRHARVMADALLIKIFEQPPIDWAGGHELQAIGARRSEYISALRAADQEDYVPLFTFAGLKSKG
ncbi:MAG: mobile mystery protein B [Nitrospirales bacterium]|nr:mobile mystery protein B [Nitrospirales bacterium]